VNWGKSVARRIAGWALIALFGPAPFTALAAYSGETECTIACCKRGHRHSCSHSDSSGSSSISASEYCHAQCFRGAAGLGTVFAALLRLASWPATARVAQEPVSAGPAPAFISFTDPYLFERPPPALFG